MAEAEPEVVQAWVCDQPAPGVTYRVLRDEWIEREDHFIRLIFEIKVETPEAEVA